MLHLVKRLLLRPKKESYYHVNTFVYPFLFRYIDVCNLWVSWLGLRCATGWPPYCVSHKCSSRMSCGFDIIIMYNYVYIYSIWQTEFTNEIRREFSIRAGVGVSLFEDWYNPNGSSVHRVSGGKTEAQKMPKTEASTTYAMKHGKIVRIQWKMVPVLWTKISPHYQRPLVMWVKQS